MKSKNNIIYFVSFFMAISASFVLAQNGIIIQSNKIPNVGVVVPEETIRRSNLSRAEWEALAKKVLQEAEIIEVGLVETTKKIPPRVPLIVVLNPESMRLPDGTSLRTSLGIPNSGPISHQLIMDANAAAKFSADELRDILTHEITHRHVYGERRAAQACEGLCEMVSETVEGLPVDKKVVEEFRKVQEQDFARYLRNMFF